MASYNSFANAGQRITFKIESLKLIRVHGFQNQYLRPFRTAMTGTVESNIREMTDKFNGSIPTNLISETCNNFIMPSERVESYQGQTMAVAMPNGWGDNRYTFIMIVETTADNLVTRELIAGYTDCRDVAMRGIQDILISPNTVFYVNTVTKLSQRSVNGIQIPTVAGSYSVIGSGFSVDAYNGATTWRMTPQNLIQSAKASNVMGMSTLPADGHQPIIGSDYRQVQQAAVLTNRTNNSPTNVFSKIIENMATTINADPVRAQATVQGKVADPSILNSIFMGALYNFFNARVAHFDYKFLQQICPYLEQITQVDDTGYETTQYQGQWDKPTIESIMAVVVSNIVTSFMTTSSLTAIEFTITNMLPIATMGGLSNFATQTTITDIRGYSQMINLAQFIPAYQQRLTDELGPIVSRGNNVGFTLYVRADMGVDIFMRLKYDNGIEEAFVFPMFADSIISPMLTTSTDLYRHNAADINTAMDIVTDVYDEKIFGSSAKQGWSNNPAVDFNGTVNTQMGYGQNPNGQHY